MRGRRVLKLGHANDECEIPTEEENNMRREVSQSLTYSHLLLLLRIKYKFKIEK